MNKDCSSFLRWTQIRQTVQGISPVQAWILDRVDILTSVFASDGSGNSISSGPSAFQIRLHPPSPLPTLLSIVKMISKGNGRIGVASFRADQPNLYHGTLCQTKAYWNHREDSRLEIEVQKQICIVHAGRFLFSFFLKISTKMYEMHRVFNFFLKQCTD